MATPMPITRRSALQAALGVAFVPPALATAPVALPQPDTMAAWFQGYDALDAMPGGPEYDAAFEVSRLAFGPHLEISTIEGARRTLAELREDLTNWNGRHGVMADILDAFLATLAGGSAQ